jgi:ATPase subunit of ABC transporter with duplicated ATPase domains
VAITHDRYFLDNAAGWILELDRGHGIPYEGNYTSWLEQKDARLEQEQRTEAAHQKALKTELEWVRQNPKGRQAKSKARLARFDELQSQEFQARNETNEIYIPPGKREQRLWRPPLDRQLVTEYSQRCSSRDCRW